MGGCSDVGTATQGQRLLDALAGRVAGGAPPLPLALGKPVLGLRVCAEQERRAVARNRGSGMAFSPHTPPLRFAVEQTSSSK
mmetsp:Transcript_97125/g.163370  ORF Transcript_97125/g.163370 Transcript_97125/m.163370 type:complete len:82 (-) Transcript_97125:561-806(-)